ncbi:MAG: ABC transporter ATP-binding protein [Candidatus Magasanikbacteria bacterium]|nr:ABC transporter ATP-binding protein [Candidatus Magasanikbacteria bacterium]
MNYELNKNQTDTNKNSATSAAAKLWPLISKEKGTLTMAIIAMVLNSLLNLGAPFLTAHVIDTYIPARDYQGLWLYSGIILTMYLVGLGTSYAQTRLMGGVGQRVLYDLRNLVFTKLQSLPVAFFNQNKAGDLISRLNNDTDKLNQFFSQSLMQFIGSIFMMTGAGIFLITLQPKLGLATLLPAIILLFVTRFLSGWVKRQNGKSMQALGGLSAEIQESLQNFKVIIAFNRRDYFNEKFSEANTINYQAAIKAGNANTIFMPLYGFAAHIGQLIVVAYGIYLITTGHFSIGLLISFLAYSNNFYQPLRQLAALWSNFQVAMAGWDRITEILALESNLKTIPAETSTSNESLLEFKEVTFGYPNGHEILHKINFTLQPGKTYALVGPTGGGKTTTASLMARLYDPTSGLVFLNGKDLRTYSETERTKKIGFILQEPFLFSGSIQDNIVYGSEEYDSISTEKMKETLQTLGLDELLDRFDSGLETKIKGSGDGLSLGQKQLIAFIRAVLRKPDLLILDEATANIDTITEQLLENILTHLPSTTTRVIIAHRLNTIAAADEIFFINDGSVIPAGSMEHAVEMLKDNKRAS